MPAHAAHTSLRVPSRRCVVCREPAPKPQLVRVVRRPDGEVLVGARADGRGAYVHANADCLSAVSSEPRHLSRALGRTPDAAVLEELRQHATTTRERP